MSSGADRRVFFALWPDARVRARLAAAGRAWLGGSSARLVHAGNLHLTLAYLGPVADTRLAEVRRAAGSVPLQPCELCIDHGGWWRRPRVAWLAPSRTPAALITMEAALWRALRPLGWHRDHPDFQPHVTIARQQRAAPPSFTSPPVRWLCDGFVLCESVSTEQGVRYRVIDRWQR